VIYLSKLLSLAGPFHHIHKKTSALEIYELVEGLGGHSGLLFDPAGHITLRIPHYPIPNSLSHWLLPIFKGFCSATLLEDLSALGNSFLLWRGPCPLVAIDKTFRSTPVSNATAELELLCSVYVTLPRHPTCCIGSTSLVSLFINDCFSFRKKAYQANFTLKSQISTN